MAEDAVLQTLYDHYKDTCRGLHEACRQRERLFFGTVGAVALLYFQFASPTGSRDAIGDCLKAQFHLTAPPDMQFVATLIWVTILVLVVAYFRVVIHLERHYRYLHTLEDELNRRLGTPLLTREGATYLGAYPLVLQMAHQLYRTVFPVALVVMAAQQIRTELRIPRAAWSPINVGIGAAVILFTLAYLGFVHGLAAKTRSWFNRRPGRRPPLSSATSSVELPERPEVASCDRS